VTEGICKPITVWQKENEMAHELSTRNNGFVEMAYTGEKPWHGLGQSLDANASIEEWQRQAGMDWKIQRSKVRYATTMGTPETLLIDDANHVLFRSDSKVPLGLVSAGFKVVQPHETLEFFRDLVESAGYKLCTAGVLKGGRKFWAQAECGMTDNVIGNDVMKGRLLIATSCDGTMATVVKNVVERVVCANTLAIATNEGGKQVKVSHRSVFDASAVKGRLGITVEDFETFIAKARTLALSQVTRQEAREFLMPIFELTNEDLAKGGRKVNGYEKVMDLFLTSGKGSQMAGVNHTAWGLVNAVTEYVDHHRGNGGTTRDNRLDYAWFGAGDVMKTEVFDKALIAFG
jgi:phage/plasmid-like protein (TIGR03299 family)